MKKITLLLVAVAATLTCCKKAKDAPNATEIGLASKWELRESIGGIWGMMTLQPGNNNILEFKSDGSFSYSDQNTIFQSGTYDLQSTGQNDQYLVTFHPTQSGERTWNALVKGDSLLLWKEPECCDIPYNNKYVRL